MLPGSDSQVDLPPRLLVRSGLSGELPRFGLQAQHAVNHPDGQLTCSAPRHKKIRTPRLFDNKRSQKNTPDRSPTWVKFPINAKSKLRAQAGPVGPSRGVRVWASVSCWPGAFTTYRYSSATHNKTNTCFNHRAGTRQNNLIKMYLYLLTSNFYTDPNLGSRCWCQSSLSCPRRRQSPLKGRKSSLKKRPHVCRKVLKRGKGRADAPHLASSSFSSQSGVKSHILSASTHGSFGGWGNSAKVPFSTWKARKTKKKQSQKAYPFYSYISYFKMIN